MSILSESAIKRSNLVKTGLQCVVAGIVEWALVGRFRWYPMYIVNAVALLLVGAGILFCVIAVIIRSIRAHRSDKTVYSAKRYLIAFAGQYRDTQDPDIAELVNAIYVMRKAGLLTPTAEDKKLSGTVQMQDTDTDTDVDADAVIDAVAVKQTSKDSLNVNTVNKTKRTVSQKKPQTTKQTVVNSTEQTVVQNETTIADSGTVAPQNTAPRRRVVRRQK